MPIDRSGYASETFEEIVGRRLARRSFLKGAIAAASLLAVTDGLFMSRGADAAEVDGLAFESLHLDNSDEVLAAPG
jgi:secreted PhoX family phosphatase